MKKVQKLQAQLFLITLLFVFGACSSPTKSNDSTDSVTHEFTVTRNVNWVTVNGISLTMDIYTPKTGRNNYPVLVIYHGGGWLINTNAVMDSMSAYLAAHGEYVICNVNYRLLGDQNNTVTMNAMIEDAMGAVVWIKEHIAAYKGDATKILVTGDSAGGHLAAMVVLAGNKLESDGFAGATLGFKPTYIPNGKTAEQLAAENALDVQAAVFSYGAFDIYGSCLGGLESPGNYFWMMAGKTARGIFGDSISVQSHPDWYKAVSPYYIIPKPTVRAMPPIFCHVGSRDNVTTPASVKGFVDLANAIGHKVEYWVHEGRQHAYLDSAPNQYLSTEFTRDGRPALEKILVFMNKVFYP